MRIGRVIVAHMLESTQQLLLDQCGDAIAIIDARRADLPLLAANRTCRALFPDSTADSDRFLDRIAARVPEHDLRATIRATLASGETTTWHDVPLPSLASPSPRDETTYWSWRFQPTGDNGGEPEQLILVLTDTTAAHRHTAALDAVFGVLLDGLLILDQHGAIVRENEAAARLLGLSPPLHGRPLGDLLRAVAARRDDGELGDLDDTLIGPALRGERRADAHILLGDDTQEQCGRSVAITIAPIHGTGAAPGGVVVVIRDISAQKESEQEQDSFLSLIAHEIKSPLTSIKGFSQLARRAIEGDNDPLQRTAKRLRVIEQQADRIGHLVNDLSELSRLQRGSLQLEPTIFDLVALARTVVEQQRVVLHHAHRLDFNAPTEALIVQADPRRVQQIVANLIANAAKYSPRADTVAVTIVREEPFARLTVQDWGLGIAAEDRPQVFERFFRASGGMSGLGLGLFIAHQIAAQSGGALTVESEEGQGSTFRLDLPLAHPGTDDE